MILKVEGLEELSKVLKNIPEDARKAAADELKVCLVDLQGKSIALAPKDKGDLRGSSVTEVNINASGVDGMIGFNTPYATRQHEEMDYRHTDGQAKYLENPWKANINRYIKAIGDAIQRKVDK